MPKSNAGRPYRDLTGQKFGVLTPLYPTDKRTERGYVVWKCCCICGDTVEANTHQIQALRKNCHCKGKGPPSGRVVGRVTCGIKTKKKNSRGYPLYKCQCSCGKTILRPSHFFRPCKSLKRRAKSCGCLKKEMIQKQRYAFRAKPPQWLHQLSKFSKVNRLRALIRKGKSLRELAKMEGLSCQRIHQLLQSNN